MFDVRVLLALVPEPDVADEVHDVGDVDAVGLHQLDAEINVVQDGRHIAGVAVLLVEHEVLALVVLVLLLGHDERRLVDGELDKGLQRLEVLRQLSEYDDEPPLLLLALHRIDVLREERDLLQLERILVELGDVVVEAGRHDAVERLGDLREERKRLVRPPLEVAVADNDAERLCLLLHAVRAGVRLKQRVVLKLLVHIEDRERLGVEAGEEHIHHEQNVELLGLLAFDAIRDVLVVGGEGVRGEVRAVAGVVVADDALQGVAAQLVLSLGVLVRAIGEYRADGEVVVDGLEEVVVAD